MLFEADFPVEKSRGKCEKVQIILKDYNLEITFDNNEKRIFEVKPYFKFKIFQELKDEEKFSTVKVAGLSIEWEKLFCRVE